RGSRRSRSWRRGCAHSSPPPTSRGAGWAGTKAICFARSSSPPSRSARSPRGSAWSCQPALAPACSPPMRASSCRRCASSVRGRGALTVLRDERERLRASERARGLDAAGRVEGRLTLVLALCYLPALMLLVVIPLFLGLLDGLFV